MVVTVDEFLKYTGPDKDTKYEGPFLRPRAICSDGYSVSIQANYAAYCTPRRDDAEKYTDVELRFPIAEDEIINDWAEDLDKPIDTIYPFVPVSLVDRLISKHGGICGYIDILTNKTYYFEYTCGKDGCGMILTTSQKS